jgi:hypothetical protein
MVAVRASVLGLSLIAAGALAAQPLEIPEPEPGPLGRVVAPRALPDDCLAVVEIGRVDGEAAIAPAEGLLIEPGWHSFNGRAILDAERCRALGEDLVLPPAADLAINVEAGKVYSIAYDRSHRDPQHWRLVVWKVADMPVDAPAGPDAAGETPDAADLPQ